MRFFLLLISLLMGMSAHGQHILCGMAKSFVEEDLFYKIDALPDQYSLGSTGDDNLWLFTSLKGPRSLRYESMNAVNGRYANLFPGAEMVLRTPEGKEIYLQNLNGSWMQLGHVQNDELSVEPKVVKYNPPLKSCTPQSENISNRHATTVSGPPAVSYAYNDIKDASGVLYLPDGIYDVDRTTRKITSIVDDETVERTEFYFEDQLSGNIVMVVSMAEDNATIDAIRYMSKEDEYTFSASSNSREFLLYPNTGYGEVRLEFTNFKPGKYSLIVYDIVGRELWKKQFDIVANITLKEDLSFLPRGTYPYTIIDEDQNRILTRRLAIIKS